MKAASKVVPKLGADDSSKICFDYERGWRAFMTVTLIFVVLSIALLYGHFRWVGLDPESPRRRSRASAIFSAIYVTVLIAIGAGLAGPGRSDLAAVAVAFGVGSVASQALRPPEYERGEGWFTRKWAAMPAAFADAVAKTVLIALVSPIVSWLGVPRPAYWITVALVIWTGINKFAIVALAANDEKRPDLRAAYSEEFPRGIIPTFVGGQLFVAAWYFVSWPMVESVPEANLHSYGAAMAFIAGIVANAH